MDILVVYIYIYIVCDYSQPVAAAVATDIYIYTYTYIYTHISISIRFVLLHIAGMHTARLRARLLSRILFGKCWPCRRCRQAASRGCQAASKICDCFESFPRPLGPARVQKHTSSETGSVTRPGSVAVSQPAQTKRSKRLVERGRVSGEDPGISGWGRGGEERQVNKM